MRDLTDRQQNRHVLHRASELLTTHGPEVVELDRMATVGGLSNTDPLALEALRCARSRWVIQQAVENMSDASEAERSVSNPVAKLSVVWAMYRETARMSGSDGGQDFIRMKIEQIRWLVADLGIAWHLIAVDDGCPDRPSSAEVARAIADDAMESSGIDERMSVLALADGIGRSVSPEGVRLDRLSTEWGQLSSPKQSRKGGSILYGLWHAVNDGHDHDQRPHVVAYTDADLSANLAQLGLVAEPIIAGRASTVAGQRYGLDGSVLVTAAGPKVEPASTGSKPDKMIVLFRHFVRCRLLPMIADVLDTQAAFKGFDARVLGNALRLMTSFDESFDVELLLRLTLDATDHAGVEVVPIVFVEDFAGSQFPTAIEHDDAGSYAVAGPRHLDMIKQLLAVYEQVVARRIEPTAEAAQLAMWLRGLSVDEYAAIIRYLQDQDRRRARAGRPDPMFEWRWTVEELTAAGRH